MEKAELMQLLEHNLVRVVFTKKSTGERREMRATLHPSVLPPPPPADPSKPKRKSPENVIIAWDVEASNFRSFDPLDLLEDPLVLEVYPK